MCTYHPAYQMYVRDGYELHAQQVIHEIDVDWVGMKSDDTE